MCLVGVSAIFIRLPAASVVPYVISGIEIAFGIWLTWISLAKDMKEPSVGTSRGTRGQP